MIDKGKLRSSAKIDDDGWTEGGFLSDFDTGVVMVNDPVHPDAINCGGAQIACGRAGALHEAGLNCASDLPQTSFDNRPVTTEACHSALTSVELGLLLLGAEGVGTLSVSSTLVVRDTT